ncbi:hypothetical protein FOFC_13672 [Fusarium oxysporum]|nr:hypothetical protein FOFC_13672 [Fusarium oxysporum]
MWSSTFLSSFPLSPLPLHSSSLDHPGWFSKACCTSS